jgi:hypothetical protein
VIYLFFFLRFPFLPLNCGSLVFLRLRVLSCVMSLHLTALLLFLLLLLSAVQAAGWAAPQ